MNVSKFVDKITFGINSRNEKKKKIMKLKNTKIVYLIS